MGCGALQAWPLMSGLAMLMGLACYLMPSDSFTLKGDMRAHYCRGEVMRSVWIIHSFTSHGKP